MLAQVDNPRFVFAVAMGVRLAAIFALGHYRAPTLWENGVIAQYLSSGAGFRADFSSPGELTSTQAPAYPYLLWAAWSIGGQTPWVYLAISVGQALALASIVFPVRAMTARWFGPRAATIAMWVGCLMPLHVWYASRIHQVAFVMAAQPWVLWAWLRLRDRATPARALAAGAATGAAALVQPVLLGVFGLIAALLGWQRGPRRNLHLYALAALAVVFVLAPWTIRNYRVHGRFVPVKDTFAKEFWMGNNPGATGSSFIEGGVEEITFARPPRAFALRGKAPEIALLEAMRREAFEYIRAEPAAFVRRTLRKIVWFWTIAPEHLVRSSLGGEARRFRLLQIAYWSVLMALCAIALFTGGARLPWLAVAAQRQRRQPRPAAAGGAGLPWLAVAAQRRRRQPRLEYFLILLTYIMFYSAIYGLTHVGQARYRGEMEFIVIPLAACGVWRLIRRFARRPGCCARFASKTRR